MNSILPAKSTGRMGYPKVPLTTNVWNQSVVDSAVETVLPDCSCQCTAIVRCSPTTTLKYAHPAADVGDVRSKGDFVVSAVGSVVGDHLRVGVSGVDAVRARRPVGQNRPPEVAVTGAAIAERVRNAPLSQSNGCRRQGVGCVCYARRQQANRQKDSRKKTGQEAENPHKSAGKDLILKGRGPEDRRGLEIIRIKDAVGKGKKRCERAAGKHTKEQIKRNRPSRPAGLRRKRLNHRPPEKYRRK